MQPCAAVGEKMGSAGPGLPRSRHRTFSASGFSGPAAERPGPLSTAPGVTLQAVTRSFLRLRRQWLTQRTGIAAYLHRPRPHGAIGNPRDAQTTWGYCSGQTGSLCPQPSR